MRNKFFIVMSVILAGCLTFTAQATPNHKSKNSPNQTKKVVVVKQPQKKKTVVVKQPQHKKVVNKKTVVIKQQSKHKVVSKKQVVVVKKKPVKHSNKPKHKVNNNTVIIIK